MREDYKKGFLSKEKVDLLEQIEFGISKQSQTPSMQSFSTHKLTNSFNSS